jgi:hypothetical protein
MDHEHQAGFTKPFGNWKPLLGPERALIKRLFQIDFAATSRAAGLPAYGMGMPSAKRAVMILSLDQPDFRASGSTKT